MPNTHTTLTGLFTDIADAIREKDGTSTPKIADAFPAAIRAIPSGGDTDVEDGLITKQISGAYTNARVSKIGNDVFSDCRSLAAVSFPACTTIGNYAFNGCTILAAVSFPACTTIGNYAFNGCTILAAASFPACTTIGTYAFSDCTILAAASFPACTTIGYGAFSGCTILAAASFPACTTIGTYAFNGCRSLAAVSFPACTTIGSYAFRSCYNLLSFYLAASSVCVLSKSDAFTSTPIAGYTASTGGVYGSIFVPASLVDAYKSATNWTYFADRITAIPEGA